ncbi:hypothetical protein cyc_07608 [Cyclospora cayetanensis]|uniref:Uncharacterized protein n=1 Tax=Cyclospora cayetanensis TaxID=88456 RepID=A0A1D3CT10_9EIME|nr:hypothetical protein cyc_07608 [Cyclospora cayetanensis]
MRRSLSSLSLYTGEFSLSSAIPGVSFGSVVAESEVSSEVPDADTLAATEAFPLCLGFALLQQHGQLEELCEGAESAAECQVSSLDLAAGEGDSGRGLVPSCKNAGRTSSLMRLVWKAHAATYE